MDESIENLKNKAKKYDAIVSADGKAREIVKELLGCAPDGAERMWFETAQRQIEEIDALRQRVAVLTKERDEARCALQRRTDERDAYLRAAMERFEPDPIPTPVTVMLVVLASVAVGVLASLLFGR